MIARNESLVPYYRKVYYIYDTLFQKLISGLSPASIVWRAPQRALAEPEPLQPNTKHQASNDDLVGVPADGAA
jgi:hypothetical protein